MPSWRKCHKWNLKVVSFSLEKAVAPHSSTLAWKIPWMEEPGGLQSVGSLRVGHDWATSLSLSLSTFLHWRRKWQPTPVFLSGESQGRGSLVGCRLWGRTESDMTEAVFHWAEVREGHGRQRNIHENQFSFFYYCLSSWTPLVLWSAWFSFAESCFSIFYQKDVCDLKKVEPQSGMITLTFLYISSLSLELRNGQQNSVCLQWLIYLLCIFYSRTYIYVCVSTHTHTHTQNIYIYIPKSAQIISFH